LEASAEMGIHFTDLKLWMFLRCISAARSHHIA
jgi:hypothetical protein